MHSTKKIALITGASSGIGASVSIELSKIGYEVILSSRNVSLLNKTANKISDIGGTSHVVEMDISNYKSV